MKHHRLTRLIAALSIDRRSLGYERPAPSLFGGSCRSHHAVFHRRDHRAYGLHGGHER